MILLAFAVCINKRLFSFPMGGRAGTQVLFKQFFATAVMGLGHGLILLPVLLSLVGPASYR